MLLGDDSVEFTGVAFVQQLNAKAVVRFECKAGRVQVFNLGLRLLAWLFLSVVLYQHDVPCARMSSCL